MNDKFPALCVVSNGEYGDEEVKCIEYYEEAEFYGYVLCDKKEI